MVWIKKMTKFFRFLVTFSFFVLISFEAISKKAAIVIDFDTKEVLFEINADTRNYPASLAKIMTLYIVLYVYLVLFF